MTGHKIKRVNKKSMSLMAAVHVSSLLHTFTTQRTRSLLTLLSALFHGSLFPDEKRDEGMIYIYTETKLTRVV